MFDKDIKILGKHATYIKFLAKKTTELNKNAISAEVFRRYLDVYIAGVTIGLVKHLKADVDNTSDDYANLLASQVIGEQSKLKMLYRMTQLLDDTSLSADDRIDLAFRYDSNDEKVKQGMDAFNSYARGGIEWLYEYFTSEATTKEDYLEKIALLVSEFGQDYEEAMPQNND